MVTKNYWVGCAIALGGSVSALFLRLTGNVFFAFALVIALFLLAGFYVFAFTKIKRKAKSGCKAAIRIMEAIVTAGLAVCSIPLISGSLSLTAPVLLGSTLFLMNGIRYLPSVMAAFRNATSGLGDIITRIVICLSVVALLGVSVMAVIELLQGDENGFFVRWQLPAGLFATAMLNGTTALLGSLQKRAFKKKFNRRMGWEK